MHHPFPRTVIKPCSYLQGTHCTKIGVKCVEKRWFCGNDKCLIADKEQVTLTRPPAPPKPPGQE